MKKHIPTLFLSFTLTLTLTLALTLTLTPALHSQVPQGIPYQAVMRNADGSVMANSAVSLTFMIHDNTANLTVYKERHSLTSNAEGLVSCVVGNGVVLQGNFSQINGDSGNKLLHVIMDSTDLEIQQILSVPYVLYVAKSGAQGPQGRIGLTGPSAPEGTEGTAGIGNGFTHWVGERFGGGVVFHVYKDALGVEHGLIVSLTELGQVPWGLDGTDVPNCESTWNGAANTAAIMAAGVEAGSAAELCDVYEAGGFADWYLPAIDELNLMYNARYNLNQSLSQIGGGAPFDLNAYPLYWSSSEYDSDYAGIFYFDYGNPPSNKYQYQLVRAVRAF